MYYEFIKEVRNNLTSCETDNEADIYLEMLLHVFEILDGRIKANPDFMQSLNKIKIVSESNSKQSCIHFSCDNFLELLAYFQYQKRIIYKSLQFIRVIQEQRKKIQSNDNIFAISWRNELKEFYPTMTRIKDKTNKFSLLSEKIKYLQKERRNLSKQFQKEGKDLYSSPLNFFFESRIECLKDSLLVLVDVPVANENRRFIDDSKFQSINCDRLKWTESKTALVELIYALHSSQSINEGRVEIRKVAQIFENIFDVDLGDVYHTFSEIRSRKIEQTKFLDHIKDSLLSKMKEANEKIIQ